MNELSHLIGSAELWIILGSCFVLTTFLPYTILRLTNHVNNKRDFQKFISRSWLCTVAPFCVFIGGILCPSIDDEIIKYLLYYLAAQGLVFTLGNTLETVHFQKNGMDLQLGMDKHRSDEAIDKRKKSERK